MSEYEEGEYAEVSPQEVDEATILESVMVVDEGTNTGPGVENTTAPDDAEAVIISAPIHYEIGPEDEMDVVSIFLSEGFLQQPIEELEFEEDIEFEEDVFVVEEEEEVESIKEVKEEEEECPPESEEDYTSMLKYPFRSKTSVSESSRESQSRSSGASMSKDSSTERLALLKGPQLDHYLTPFYLRWSFGVSSNTPTINLTTRSNTLVFYTASHAGVLYDYVSSEMKLLQGHKNLISSIATDDSGRWLVSADAGNDNTIIVWDCTEHMPVNTIFNPHPDCGTAVVEISGNAKYLASIGNEIKPVLNFWLWTYGNDKPDDTYTFKSGYGRAVKIRFNPNVQEHIMVAFEKQIIFFEWDLANNKLLEPVFPQVRNVKKMGFVTDCTYIDTCHECAATTTEGYVLIFGSTLYTRTFEESDLQNIKIFSKAIKISSSSINCIETADGVVVTGDNRGHIKFYDKRFKILFWCQEFKLPPITSISFNLDKRIYKLKNALDDDTECNLDTCMCEDRSQEFEYIYSQLVPTDATLQQLPFIVRDFIIATIDGRIASIDYMRNKCNFFFRRADAPVTAIDTHDEKHYLVIGYENGNICLYNYITRELVIEQSLPELINEFTDSLVSITAVKYSPESLHLACGTDNGTIWFLDPIVLTPKGPSIRLTKSKIMKLAFSMDSRFFAYYDENTTVVLMKYSSTIADWDVLGKIRSHYKPVHDILFTPYLPSRFFSIGADRYLVEYDIQNSGKGIIELINRERIEQVTVPLSFVNYVSKEDSTDRYLLVSDDQFKYKTIHDVTYMCRSVTLGPAYGCYAHSPIKKMIILPEHHAHYLIFANNNHIGIQMLPADGNPYKYVGTIGHPIKLLDFCTSYDGTRLFTIGKEDRCVLMWEINTMSVQLMTKLGGIELEPFYCIIEGGINGWLFREMQDLFYYMQILNQGENTVLPRIVTDLIPVVELPDLMRACGFYPSEYEIENIITDIKYREYDETKMLKEKVSFQEFVKLYLNHRPAHGVSIDTLRDRFETLCLASEGPGLGSISGTSLVDMICERGEVFTSNKAYTCLATLMHTLNEEDDDTNREFTFLPQEIDFNTFLEVILGMDLERQTVDAGAAENAMEEYQDLC